MVIVVAGAIGVGKSSVAKILGKHFKTEVFYENVDDNPILPLFYNSSDEEIQKNRYPFLLQLTFLNSRFKSIKKALKNKNNILDRSIYEDLYFTQINKELGRISDLEYNIYKDLLNNMLEELDELPKKTPDLLVYLKAPFEQTLKNIKSRGRYFEIDKNLTNYYKKLHSGYDYFIYNYFEKNKVLTIDMTNFDPLKNEQDKIKLIEKVEKNLTEK